ncbi:hypothetical protein SAZ11_22545 [Streptomyces sp. FXJ1.4098]|nr:hypothetical protein [Streptomyces sp. FXJ1.4098]
MTRDAQLPRPGLVLNATLGRPWPDPIAALAIATVATTVHDFLNSG